MKQHLSKLFILALLGACQSPQASVQPSPQSPAPSNSPSASPAPTVTPTPTASVLASAQIELPVTLLQFVSTAHGDKGLPPLDSTVRFEIKSPVESTQSGQATLQWSYSAAHLRARTQPILLDVPFLKAGDLFKFSVTLISEKLGCQRAVAWDNRAVYPATRTPLIAGSAASMTTENDGFELAYNDFPTLNFSLPIHGQMLLPDGKPGNQLRVRITNLNGELIQETLSNQQGYYITEQPQSFPSEVLVQVVALSDQAVFKSYKAKFQTKSSAAFECDESLNRHDIQLLAP